MTAFRRSSRAEPWRPLRSSTAAPGTRFDIGELGYLLGWQDLSPQQSGLQNERIVLLGEVPEGLGGQHRIITSEGERRRADQVVFEVETQLLCGATSQSHFHDLELGAGSPEATSQILLSLHGQAAILGEERGRGILEPLLDLFNCLDLLRSWHGLLLKK